VRVKPGLQHLLNQRWETSISHIDFRFWILDFGLDRFGVGDLDKDNLKKIDVELKSIYYKVDN
jgi:hypothetical protein